MSKVQKDLENISAGIGFFKLLNKFSCYLRLKSARSTLTSHSQIRVNVVIYAGPNQTTCHRLSASKYAVWERVKEKN
jgi:hypothetical protein